MIKLEVPFYTQQTRMDCGPTVLRMVVDYLGNKKHEYNILCELVDSDKSGITFTLGIANAAAQLGFKVEFYTRALEPNPAVWEIEFVKETTEGFEANKKKLTNLRKEAINYGVKLQEQSLSLNQILQKLENCWIPLVLLDWSKIDTKLTRAHFHFVPIVGYDESHIYVHTEFNIGTQESRKIEARPFFQIPKDIFEQARIAFGTDEDIVFIHS